MSDLQTLATQIGIHARRARDLERALEWLANSRADDVAADNSTHISVSTRLASRCTGYEEAMRLVESWVRADLARVMHEVQASATSELTAINSMYAPLLQQTEQTP